MTEEQSKERPDLDHSLILISYCTRGTGNGLRRLAESLRSVAATAKYFGGPRFERGAFLTVSPYGKSTLEHLRKLRSPVAIDWIGKTTWAAGHELANRWCDGDHAPDENDSEAEIVSF